MRWRPRSSRSSRWGVGWDGVVGAACSDACPAPQESRGPTAAAFHAAVNRHQAPAALEIPSLRLCVPAQLERELESLAQSVLALAGGCAAAPGAAASAGGGGEEQGDIVLEFGTPRGGRGRAAAAGDVRRALADISAAQAAAARGLEDQAHQIRLLKESSKLQRLRRASALADRPPGA